MIENRKLTFLSIRISYNQNKIKYALILQENMDTSKISDIGILEITEELFQRLGNRNISINELKSIHFKLKYLYIGYYRVLIPTLCQYKRGACLSHLSYFHPFK